MPNPAAPPLSPGERLSHFERRLNDLEAAHTRLRYDTLAYVGSLNGMLRDVVAAGFIDDPSARNERLKKVLPYIGLIETSLDLE